MAWLVRSRLAARDVVVRERIPVTAVRRTLMDLASVLPAERLESSVDSAISRRFDHVIRVEA